MSRKRKGRLIGERRMRRGREGGGREEGKMEGRRGGISRSIGR